MHSTEDIPFGSLLKQLRKQAGMTQRDLAAVLGYSDSMISSLEKGQRQPDLGAMTTHFIPALGLQDDPATAALLIDRAAAARGERLHLSAALPVATRTIMQGKSDAPKVQLPLPATELLGRAKEVELLCNRLLSHGERLLTLVGPPGIGKTQLALAVAARLQYHYPDGTFFMPLAEITDANQMAATIAVAIGIQDIGSKQPKVKLIEMLRRKTLLLVLDNCEQIREASQLVAEVLGACVGVHILATSRERLHLRAEQRHRVPPLELAAAVALFSKRASAVDEDFAVTAENLATIEAICQRLDRLPLALELCAAQIDLLSLTQILAQLHDRPLDLLVNGANDLPPQHRTLRHAIDASYRLLSEAERMIFRSLGVFVGGFDLPALEAIDTWRGENAQRSELTPGTRSMLHALIGKSLVHTASMPFGEQRFFLLESIREYAIEQLRAHGEEEALRQIHYDIFLQRFRSVEHHLRGPEAVAWFARLQPEYDNLRTAMQWTFDTRRFEDALWLIGASSWFCRLRGQWYEQIGWYDHLMPHRHLLAPNLRLGLLIGFYSVARSKQESDTLNRYTDELLELAEKCTDKLQRAVAFHFAALAATDFAEAAQRWEKALVLARDGGESPTLGSEFGVSADRLFVYSSSADNYAMRLIDQGDFERAAFLIQESLQACETRGFRGGIAACKGNLGGLALLEGDLPQAYTLLQQAVTLASTSILPTVLARTKPLLAVVLLYQNDPEEARRLLLESLNLWLDMGDKFYLSRICIYLAETALWEGKVVEAEQWLAQWLTYGVDPRRTGFTLVNGLYVAARVAALQQHYRRAATLFGMAEALRISTHYVLVEPVRCQIDAALATVREGLTDEIFAEFFTSGQTLPLSASNMKLYAIDSSTVPAFFD